MKAKAFSLLRGTVEAFVAVNLLISLVSYVVYPDFFYPGLLLEPQILILTIPLSTAFHLDLKYLQEAMGDSEKGIWERFREVTRD